MRTITLLLAMLGLLACQPAEQESTESAAPAATEAAAPAEATPPTLDEVLAAQPEEVQARYEWRHPKETLEFFGIEPGMTVVEALPGGGWYTKILLPYLGSDGMLIGAAYALDLYALFPFANEEFLAQQANWTTDFAAGAEGWRGDNGASVVATRFGSIPAEYDGTVDAVLMIRAPKDVPGLPGGSKDGTPCDRIVSLQDLYPTLIDLCGLPKREDIDGRSLAPLLNNPGAAWDHPAISTYDFSEFSIRTERWRYTVYIDGSEELYDHDKDPEEWVNLADKPEYQDIKKEMAKFVPENPAPLIKTSEKLQPHHIPPFRSQAEYQEWLDHGKDTQYILKKYWQ